MKRLENNMEKAQSKESINDKILERVLEVIATLVAFGVFNAINLTGSEFLNVLSSSLTVGGIVYAAQTVFEKEKSGDELSKELRHAVGTALLTCVAFLNKDLLVHAGAQVVVGSGDFLLNQGDALLKTLSSDTLGRRIIIGSSFAAISISQGGKALDTGKSVVGGAVGSVVESGRRMNRARNSLVARIKGFSPRAFAGRKKTDISLHILNRLGIVAENVIDQIDTWNEKAQIDRDKRS